MWTNFEELTEIGPDFLLTAQNLNFKCNMVWTYNIPFLTTFMSLATSFSFRPIGHKMNSKFWRNYSCVQPHCDLWLYDYELRCAKEHVLDTRVAFVEQKRDLGRSIPVHSIINHYISSDICVFLGLQFYEGVNHVLFIYDSKLRKMYFGQIKDHL